MSDSKQKEEKSHYSFSQDFTVTPRKKTSAYPIDIQDWEKLKRDVESLEIETNVFQAFGYVLLGTSFSALITSIASTFQTEGSKYLCWGIFVVTLCTGLLSVFFANDKHKTQNLKPKTIIDQMNHIESRFNLVKTEESNEEGGKTNKEKKSSPGVTALKKYFSEVKKF